MRSICPQCKGVYVRNDGTPPYDHILLSHNQPDSEVTTIKGYECDKTGKLNPGKQYSIAFKVSDFGKFVKEK
jgi:hypothetical protein